MPHLRGIIGTGRLRSMTSLTLFCIGFLLGYIVSAILFCR